MYKILAILVLLFTTSCGIEMTHYNNTSKTTYEQYKERQLQREQLRYYQRANASYRYKK